jgi:hypothetical protein
VTPLTRYRRHEIFKKPHAEAHALTPGRIRPRKVTPTSLSQMAVDRSKADSDQIVPVVVWSPNRRLARVFMMVRAQSAMMVTSAMPWSSRPLPVSRARPLWAAHRAQERIDLEWVREHLRSRRRPQGLQAGWWLLDVITAAAIAASVNPWSCVHRWWHTRVVSQRYACALRPHPHGQHSGNPWDSSMFEARVESRNAAA